MILDDIVEKKKQRLLNNEYKFDLKDFYEYSCNNKRPSFKESLKKSGLSIIGEIKKASPSRGLIKPDFDPVKLAKEYDGAVDAISVLTEEDFFKGKAEYLTEVSQTVSLPILRKDFIISPMQIFEAKELGASAVLLITKLFDTALLSEYIKLANGLGLDALVEVHNETEVNSALNANAEIIGINNRNLLDFSEDLNTTINLRKFIPKDIVVISESSIHTTKDIETLKEANINGILVGESFMKTDDIKKKAKEFKKAYEA